MKIITSKSIFASLVIILLMSFIIDITSKNNVDTKIKPLDDKTVNNKEKILGVKIRQQNKKGEKFLIVAESLVEDNSENKKIILENSFTTINQDGIITNISAGHAVLSNNYDNFDFSDKVEIIKKVRKFVLKTERLTGTFENGSFYTNDDVDIVSGNIKIKGKGLDIKNNGEYLKIKGKAKLKMLYKLKNDD